MRHSFRQRNVSNRSGEPKKPDGMSQQHQSRQNQAEKLLSPLSSPEERG